MEKKVNQNNLLQRLFSVWKYFNSRSDPPPSGPGSRQPCKHLVPGHRLVCLCTAQELPLVAPSESPQCFLVRLLDWKYWKQKQTGAH